MLLHHKVREYLKRRLGVPDIPAALEGLTNRGFQPKQVFDVGAYKGDFARICLHLWPNTEICCFEALEHRVLQLQAMAAQQSSIKVFPTLLGSTISDKVALHQAETASSVLTEHISQEFPVAFYPMQTVDQIVQDHFSGHAPDLLKLDVQGYEMEVLKGAERTLPQIQAILAEVSLLDIHQNVPLIAELLTWLNDRDWVAYDICGLTRRPLDNALWQTDMIFVPRDSPLRLDKRWGA
jgi:FkbM family methyltransferase